MTTKHAPKPAFAPTVVHNALTNEPLVVAPLPATESSGGSEPEPHGVASTHTGCYQGGLAWVQAAGFGMIVLFTIGAASLWFWAIVQLAQLVLRAEPALGSQPFQQ
jgi:hypothetical protein